MLFRQIQQKRKATVQRGLLTQDRPREAKVGTDIDLELTIQVSKPDGAKYISEASIFSVTALTLHPHSEKADPICVYCISDRYNESN
jgi:hypothetical protein